jgi:hypothetical protein
MRKKAQAILEFLMTYSWAFFVVAVMVGALAYFGVLDFHSSEVCTGAVGLDCVDKASITGNAITVAVSNSLGFPIEIYSNDDPSNPLSISSDDCTLADALIQCPSGDTSGAATYCVVPNGGVARVRIDCANPFPDKNVKASISLGYKNQGSGMQHKATVTVQGEN